MPFQKLNEAVQNLIVAVDVTRISESDKATYEQMIERLLNFKSTITKMLKESRDCKQTIELLKSQLGAFSKAYTRCANEFDAVKTELNALIPLLIQIHADLKSKPPLSIAAEYTCALFGLNPDAKIEGYVTPDAAFIQNTRSSNTL